MNAAPSADRTPEKRHPAAKNIQAIAELEDEALQDRSAADRLSDRISRATGSTPFVVLHVAWFSVWLLINTGQVPQVRPFDPYPFSLLTLFVSLEAIFLSVFVLMSQNRLTRHAEKRAHLDLQINLLAEQELTAILEMQRAMCRKWGIDVGVTDERLKHLLEDTDVQELAADLDQKLPTA